MDASDGKEGGSFFKQHKLFVLKQTLWKTGSAVVAAGQSVRRPRRGPACGVLKERRSKVTVLLERSFLEV